MFSQAQLAQLVAETIPEDLTSTHVVVGTVDLDGVQVVASFKKAVSANGVGWELQAAARHDWTTGDNSLVGKVLLTW